MGGPFQPATSGANVPPHQTPSRDRARHAEQLVTSLGLRIDKWWQATPGSYLGRVSKTLILGAVRGTPEAAENLGGLKKDALVAEAGERLAGRGWLPTILRPSVGTHTDVLAAAE